MEEIKKLIEKWDKQVDLHRKVCEDPLMYTKEDRLKNSHYAQAICAFVSDLRELCEKQNNSLRDTNTYIENGKKVIK